MTTYRSPDLILQEKQTKTIWICEMVRPQENNIEKKRLHATYIRDKTERRTGFRDKVAPLVITAFVEVLKKC